MKKKPPKQSTKTTETIKATAPVLEAPQLGEQGRAVGLDVHPDSFAAAILEGRNPLRARVAQSITKQPLEALCAWAQRHTKAEDVLIIEASANTFAITERLAALGRQVFILSHRAGQIGKSYLANDRLDAAKIARIYLSRNNAELKKATAWMCLWDEEIRSKAREPHGSPNSDRGIY